MKKKNKIQSTKEIYKILEEELKNKGIETGTHYKPIHTFSHYKSKTKLKITENVGKSIVTIPCHSNLKESDVDKIIKSINLLDYHFLFLQ